MRYILIILLLTGCYSERKAKEQFSKAAISYPKIPAEYCASEFPVKDSTVRDTVSTTDTLYIEGLADTVMIQDFDTVRIYITKQLPGKVITNTVHIIDTIIRESTAALKLCEIDKSKLTDLLTKQTEQTEKYKSKAKKRAWFLWSLVALIILITGANVWLKSKKLFK